MPEFGVNFNVGRLNNIKSYNNINNQKIDYDLNKFIAGKTNKYNTDYEEIDYSDNTRDTTSNPRNESVKKVQTWEELVKAVEPEFKSKTYTIEEEKTILENIEDKVNQSVENEIYCDFNAECRYKFGIDLKKLDSILKLVNETNKDYTINTKITKEELISSIENNSNILLSVAGFFQNTTIAGITGVSYEKAISLMNESERNYYNQQFKTKYLEYLRSDECRNLDATDDYKKLAAIEYARKEVENEIFNKPSYKLLINNYEAIENFEIRVNSEREYYKNYYNYLYFNSELNNLDYSTNLLETFQDFYINASVAYEASTFAEVFQGITYEELMSLMTDDEIAYYNYQFRIKYAEYLCSDECRNLDATDDYKKLAATEYARKKTENELFHTQSFETRVGQLCAFYRIRDKYSSNNYEELNFKEINFDSKKSISINEAIKCLKNGEELTFFEGKFYKLSELYNKKSILIGGREYKEMIIAGPDGKYYSYYVNDVDEFYNWFGESFVNAPFNMIKGMGGVFNNDASLNKEFYEEQKMQEAINATFLGGLGYGLGDKVGATLTSMVLNSGVDKIACAFWFISAWGAQKRRTLQAGSSVGYANLRGTVSGAGVGLFAELFGASEDPLEQFLIGIRNLYYEEIGENFKDAIISNADKNFSPNSIIKGSDLVKILDDSDINIDEEGKELLIMYFDEIFNNNSQNNVVTYSDLKCVLETMK